MEYEHLRDVDPLVHDAILSEARRQTYQLEQTIERYHQLYLSLAGQRRAA